LPNNKFVKEVVLKLLKGEEITYNKYIKGNPIGPILKNWLDVMLYCPVNLSIYDLGGNHTGLDENGDLDPNIPDSYYYLIEETKIAILPRENNYGVFVNSTGEGMFDLELKYINETALATLSYESVSITNDTKGAVNYLPNSNDIPLQMDYQGDGTIDEEITPEVTVVFIPEITSSDESGNEKNQFLPGEEVYVRGCYLEANTQYKLWIQNDPVNLGILLNETEDPSGYQELITTNATGCFDPTLIWSIAAGAPPTFNSYDIIVDKQDANAGMFDLADGIDDAAVAGIIAPIPELLTFILVSIGVAVIVRSRF
jgi:hypothetical protein